MNYVLSSLRISFHLLFILFTITSLAAASTLWSSYEEKTLFAQTDYASGTPYTWTIDGQHTYQGTTSTLFLAHFDGNFLTSEGEQPNTVDSGNFVPSMFDRGLLGKAHYTEAGNLDLTKGTIELWINITEPLTSQVFNGSYLAQGDAYIFKHRNNVLDESFDIRVKQEPGDLYFMAHDGEWSNASQLSTKFYDLPTGEMIYFAYTYDRAQNLSQLHYDGFLIAQGRFDFDIDPIGEFELGNEHIIIDEFRILDEVLSSEEIMANYLRAIPFSNNDVQLDVEYTQGTSVELTIGGETLSNSVQSAKFSVTPETQVLAYQNTITITPSEQNCRYAESPKPYEQLTPITEITFNQPSAIEYYPIYIKCGGDDYAYYKRYKILPELNNNFPKTALIWWGSAVAEEEIELLATHDLIILSPANVMTPERVKAIREYNPDIMVLYYTNINGPKPEYGPGLYYVYNFPLKEQWRLKDPQGNLLINYQYPPPPYNIYHYPESREVYAQWMKTMYLDRGIFDGLFMDNYNSFVWWLKDEQGNLYTTDIDEDSIGEDLATQEGQNYFRQRWDQAIDVLGQRFREVLGPNILVTGNNAMKPYAAQVLNGKYWEGSFKLMDFESLTDPANTASFAYWQEQAQEPKINVNMFYTSGAYSSPESWKRYGLVMSLFFDLYHYQTVTNDEYRDFFWMDEYWVNRASGLASTNPLDKGYLGSPNAAYYEIASDVYRRDFEYGIALLNNKANSITVNLETTYRHIQGTQDPSANPGGDTSSVTLGPYDGRILLRKTTTNGYTLADFLDLSQHYHSVYPDYDGNWYLDLVDLVLLGKGFS